MGVRKDGSSRPAREKVSETPISKTKYTKADMAPVLACLPSMSMALGSIPSTTTTIIILKI
jgi:hypothetical protein